MFNLLNHYDLYLAWVAVAESETLLQAAKKLQVSQATVSLRLKRLQAQFGFPILEKRGRRIVVLEAGHRLKDAIQASLGDLQSRLSSFELSAGHPVTRPIKIGARQEVFLKLGPRFKSPVPIQLLPMMSFQTKTALLKSEIDVAVTHTRPNNLDFIAQPLFLDSFVLCAHRKVARGLVWPPKTAQDYAALFARMPVLSYGPDSKLLLDLCKAHGVDSELIRPAVVCEDWSVLRNFLRGGSGFGLFPKTFVQGLESAVLRHPISPKVLKPLQFHYVYKQEFRSNAQLRELGAALAMALG